ncbi:hypothetical protein H2204_004310 [Knufia peltigerae]|uniref:Uncharacterized protein n=1 Tax=Knufia peltigerae TaxID=1002370 RepID=A0AA39D0V0_9EURO|nr:hypothetical protein H2204_004310 [Knufia peltigerae]
MGDPHEPHESYGRQRISLPLDNDNGWTNVETRTQNLDNGEFAENIPSVNNAQATVDDDQPFPENDNPFEPWDSINWENYLPPGTLDRVVTHVDPPTTIQELLSAQYGGREVSPTVDENESETHTPPDTPPGTPPFPWGDCLVGLDPARLEAPADEEAVAEINRLMPGELVYPMDLFREMRAFEMNEPYESSEGGSTDSGHDQRQEDTGHNSEHDSEQARPVTPEQTQREQSFEPEGSEATLTNIDMEAWYEELCQTLVDDGMIDIAGRFHAQNPIEEED